MTTPSKLNTTLHLRLIELSAEAAGFSASEITGYGPEKVRTAAEALVKAGKLVRHKVSPRRVRYFVNETLARAYQAKPARHVGNAVTGGPRFKAAWSVDEPAIITPRTKIYIAPPLPRDVFRTATYPQF
jgi:hypothetical protein